MIILLGGYKMKMNEKVVGYGLISSWEELHKAIIKNISYWGWYISKKTSIEVDEAKQQLLVKIWESFSKKSLNGKPVTKYLMQKLLGWYSSRIIHNFYRKKQIMNVHSLESLDEMGVQIPYIDKNEELLAVSRVMNEVGNIFKANVKMEKVLAIFDRLREGKRNVDIARELKISDSYVFTMKERYIKPLIMQKAFEHDIVPRNNRSFTG
jgi:hypothetical protein